MYNTEDLDELFADDLDIDASSDGGVSLYEHFRVVADKGQELVRVDKFLIDHLPHASRNRIQKAAEAGCLHANGKPVKSNYRVKPRDIITLMMDRPRMNTEIEPEDIPLDIVYEDDDLMVINKPAGMPIHPSQGNYDNTLANACAWYFENKGEPFTYRCINRLDRDTTGLLIIARHSYSASLLSTMVAKREIHREYRALATGLLPEEGTVEAPIARVDGSTIEREVNFEIGEFARTHYKRLEYKNGYSLASLKLDTGRTHQIRVHMKHIGHPLPGDFLYNPDYSVIQRQALHSYRLRFRHPITGEMLDFTAPIPEDMNQVLQFETATTNEFS